MIRLGGKSSRGQIEEAILDTITLILIQLGKLKKFFPYRTSSAELVSVSNTFSWVIIR